MKKIYSDPEMDLIEIVDIIATNNFDNSGDLDNFGNGDGNNIGDLVGGGN